MKKYVTGFLFFFCLTTCCLITLFLMTRSIEHEEVQKVQATESVEQPGFAENEAEVTGGIPSAPRLPEETSAHIVLNQEHVLSEISKESYCLVAEDGYLIVYNSDRVTVNLFTHMPLAEFPVTEQERLMAGIWFPTMAEIFSYLESYSS